MIRGTDTYRRTSQARTSTKRRRAATHGLAAGVAMCAVLLAGASSAWAGVGFGIVPSVPQQVTVGTTVPAALVITNVSADNVAGESGYGTDSYQLDDITLVPSCGSPVVGADCPTGSWDPGVLVPSPLTALGRAGTACQNRSFTITLDQQVPQGKYRFTPDAPVVLGPSEGSLAVRRCIIDYTLDVKRSPAIDSDVGAGGLQTDQKAYTIGHDITPGTNFNLPGGGTGSARTTVTRAPTAITTDATASLKLGAGSFSDVARITGRVNPAGPSSVTFELYGPDNSACTGTPIFSSTVAVPASPVSPVSVPSAPFTPTQAGTYRWVASYSGDTNNAGSAGACGDANETTVVAKATPAITTDASNDMKIGGDLSDVAKITGRSNPIGTSSVVFRLYGPNDDSCTGTPVYTSTVSVPASPVSPVSVTSGSYKPTAVGTYRWVASYTGDANNAAADGVCNDADENTVVAKATPAITTDASNDMKIGGDLSDVATISGRVSPAGSSSVVFRLYGPNDDSCTGTPVYTSTVSVPASPVSPVSVTSGSFTPTAVGTYRWVATYSGDANNARADGACNDANENATVAKATPAITTDASNDMKIGGDLSDV
ncbi:MAG: hypothetical protein QOE31_1272, partial [Solirubrobacteraceae bacterium]|nr:hypothetical protein [Solirubrobacteraceae bacterium]